MRINTLAKWLKPHLTISAMSIFLVLCLGLSSSADGYACTPGSPPTHSDWGGHAGWSRPQSQLTGVQGQIYEYNPHVAASDVVTAWTFLTDAIAPTTNWAQVGWMKV